MAEIHRRGRLIVGIGTNAYLLAFRDPRDRQIHGFEADLAREIAYAIFGDRERIQFRSLNLSEVIPAVRGANDSGEQQLENFDIVLLTTTMTCDRWRKVSFSAEYYSSSQRLLVHHDSPVTGIADLAGKRVCAASGSTNLQVITSAESRLLPVAAADTSDCLLLLQQGQADAVSTDDAILAGLAAQDPLTKIVGPRLTDDPDPIGIMMAHESADLVRFVNGVLEKLIHDGTWSGLYQAWLAAQLGPAEPPIPQYLPE